jgi:hypothetical protein
MFVHRHRRINAYDQGVPFVDAELFVTFTLKLVSVWLLVLPRLELELLIIVWLPSGLLIVCSELPLSGSGTSWPLTVKLVSVWLLIVVDENDVETEEPLTLLESLLPWKSVSCPDVELDEKVLSVGKSECLRLLVVFNAAVAPTNAKVPARPKPKRRNVITERLRVRVRSLVKK